MAVLMAQAQSGTAKEFTEVCDSLSKLIYERTTVRGKLKLKSVMKRGKTLDFYFTESLGDYPWKAEDITWFRKNLRKLFPRKYCSYSLGDIYSKRLKFETFPTPHIGKDGRPVQTKHIRQIPCDRTPVLVRNLDEPRYENGMTGRTIALWQSHGRYFDQNENLWKWQRPCLFTTTEDMFTQGTVLDFLVPMLENAGAYTMLPRERDPQREEFIVDNDPYSTEGSPRGHGKFSTKGKWDLCGIGFADTKPCYEGTENPFRNGLTLKTKSVPSDSKTDISTAEWLPDIRTKGNYAVYVSYQSLPESTENALYKVIHDGGTTEFSVNQKIGGSMWVYLGTFPFAPASGHKVVLENKTPQGCKFQKGIVTADAVKIGGGMGNIARRNHKEPEAVPQISGLPRYAEGARYWMQWAGIDSTVYCHSEHKNDYKDDFMSRGTWVEYLTGGSHLNPKMKNGKSIPVDLSFALHSDAGVTPNDSTIGTLSIYTYKSENKTVFPGGGSRLTSREFADLVQTQVVNDIRAQYDSIWNRRHIWDRYYSESRKPSVPAMLLEFLSHQNFADMKYGLDPKFRFTTARAIYKGMLKYMSNIYEIPYIVQPLPVRDFSVRLDKDSKEAILSWKATDDLLEPTARPTAFLVETRTGNKSFGKGRQVSPTLSEDGTYSVRWKITAGELWSFRVIARNSGGKSFPSEALSAAIAGKEDKGTVMIVNNFDRVSGPSWFDTPTHGGFDATTDRGVPYMRDLTYMGDMYEFRRDKEWVTNDNGGFGASYQDYAGYTVAGNTFDYPSLHGKAVLEAGHSFVSSSASAFADDPSLVSGIWAIDLICGKQITTMVGKGEKPAINMVFPEKLQSRIREYCQDGGNILVSGANVATDIWDSIYPVKKDSIFTETSMKFAREILGYKWGGNHAGRLGKVYENGDRTDIIEFHTRPNPQRYSVESPDGILPACSKAETVYRYADTDVSAGIRFDNGKYRTVILGFPIETVIDETKIKDIITSSLEYFGNE